MAVENFWEHSRIHEQRHRYEIRVARRFKDAHVKSMVCDSWLAAEVSSWSIVVISSISSDPSGGDKGRLKVRSAGSNAPSSSINASSSLSGSESTDSRPELSESAGSYSG